MRRTMLEPGAGTVLLALLVLCAADAGAASKPKQDLTPRDPQGAVCVSARVMAATDRCAYQTVENDKSHCHPDTKYSVEFENHCDRTVYVTYHLDGSKPEPSRRGAAVVKARATQVGSLVLLKERDGSSGKLDLDTLIGQ